MIGEKVSHYKILEKLGGGGMGIVYKAQDLRLERFVALKFLPPAFSMNEESKLSIIKEARIAATLEHPNICNIHEVGETEDERIFIAMSYYEGETLKKKIKNRILSEDDIESILLQIAKGLEQAHNKGIIHGDIKPENIFITNQKEVKILDFGVAKVDNNFSVMDNNISGTIAYMSPEQISGQEIDQRSDIWSYGVLAYELITGKKPFSSEYEQSALYSIMHSEPDLSDFPRNTRVTYLKNVVQKCLMKNPDDRFQNISEVLNELESKQTKDIGRRKKKTILSKILFPVGIVLILLLIALFLKPLLFDTKEVYEPINIAVISFENQTGDESYDYLQNAIPNLLITNLEQSKYLQVATWERMHDLLKHIGKKDIKIIDKDLGFEICRMDKIDAIVLGSFIKAGNRFATDIKVFDVQTKKLLKSANTQGEGASSILESQIDYLSDEISEGVGLSASEIEAVQFRIANVSTMSLEAYKNYLTGYSNYLKNYFAEAERYFKKAIQIDSSFAIAYMYLGLSNYFSLNMEESKKALSKARLLKEHATEKEKVFIEALYLIMVEGDFEKASFLIKEGIKRYPKEKILYIWLGNYYNIGSKEYDLAIESYNKVLELDPQFNLALNSIAYAYANIKNYKKAIEYLKRYASLNPYEANSYDSMGDIYFRMGDFDKAIDSYTKAVEIKSEFFSYWKIPILFSIKEEYDTALIWIKEQLLTSYSIRKKIFAYESMGMINFLLGKYDESMKYLDRILELAEQDGFEFWDAWVKLEKAWIYFNKGELDKSLSFFTAYYNIKLNLGKTILAPEGYFNFYKGIINLRKGKINSAKNNLDEIHNLLLQLDKKNKMVKIKLDYHYRLLYGEILIKEDSLSKAEKLYKTFPEADYTGLLSPTMFQDRSIPFPKDGLARVFAKQRKIEEAIEEYEKLTSSVVLERDLQFVLPVYHFRLAKLYEEKGAVQKAIGEYEKFLTIWKDADKDLPELIDAKKRLARLKRAN